MLLEIVDDTETIVTNDTGFEKLVEPGKMIIIMQ